jgi:hypothetical protein
MTKEGVSRCKTDKHFGSDMASGSRNPTAVDNAGLVLFAPYLPALFERLGLLTSTAQGPPFVATNAMSRGTHLLQYLVDGRCDRPVSALALDKLLCGSPPDHAIEPSIRLSNTDRAICNGARNGAFDPVAEHVEQLASVAKRSFTPARGKVAPRHILLAPAGAADDV